MKGIETLKGEIRIELPRMRKITIADKLRYTFDNYMAYGPIALIGALGFVSLILILIAAMLIRLLNIAPGGQGEAPSFIEALWLSLMRTLDAGTMGNDTGWGFRLVMLGVTTGGIFIVSALIGILSNGLESRLELLRKGKSFVVEQNHILILGWSPKIFQIINELNLASESSSIGKKAKLVILANKDKLEMEEDIARHCPNLTQLRIICRTGNPIDLHDIEIVNPFQSQSIILLAPDTLDPDAHVIKQLLALTNNHSGLYKLNIVAELREGKNAEVARMIGKDELVVVLTSELITRIMAQTCRQPGLSTIYLELLSFDGCEIYFREIQSLVSRTYGDAVLSFETCAAIGLCYANGEIELNPPMGTLIATGDQIIAISNTENDVRISGLPIGSLELIQSCAIAQTKNEHTLILGWNANASNILNELDQYVPNGSMVTVVADHPLVDEQVSILRENLMNQDLMYYKADITNRGVLEAINIFSFNHIILLSYGDVMEEQQADARTLITLLHLRQMLHSSAHSHDKNISIVSEMLDLRNCELAEIARADDFIVSENLVSLLLAQVAKNKKISKVFQELFDSGGQEIYLQPIENYVALNIEMSFYTVVESAKRCGESVIGFRKCEPNTPNNITTKPNGIVLNPLKSARYTFEKGDKLIVLCER